MKYRPLLIASAICLAFGLGALTTRAQEAAAPPADFDPEAAMAAFMQKVEEARPHFEPLKVHLGEWEVIQKMYYGGPDAPPIEQTAREKNTQFGDFWVLGEVESEMMGAPFHGRSIGGYDMMKGKYVMYWVDTMAPYGMFFEGTYDQATRTFTYECSMVDGFTGLDTVYTITDRLGEDGRHSWEMTKKSAMGEMKLMEASYKPVE